MSIAAFYQCYKQSRAFLHAVDTYRHVYPTETLFIINDEGDESFDAIAKLYGAVYSYRPSIGHLCWSNRAGPTDPSIIKKPLGWLLRIQEALQVIREPYFMFLEDDVWVQKQTALSSLEFDLNGCNPHELLVPSVQAYLRERNPILKESILYIGGCGGCILRSEFFRRILADPAQIEKDLVQYYQLGGIIASDQIISYLTYLYGGTLGLFTGFSESWQPSYKQRQAEGTIEVLHQYKELYEPVKKSQGYLFIANGETYATMLKSFTIPSIRFFDKSRPITVLTSTPEFFDTSVTIILYNPEEQRQKYKHLEQSDYFILGTLPKLIIFDLSPYDETIYLDGDIINMKDIRPFWERCSASETQIIISGENTPTNRAPSHWHWGTIDEVMSATGFPIPRINGGFHYWKRTRDFMSTIEPYLSNPDKYKIKPWFRGGYVDEIFMSIYLGLKGIHPDSDENAVPPNPNSIQTYRGEYSASGNAQFFHIFNKSLLPAYFELFKQRNVHVKK